MKNLDERPDYVITIEPDYDTDYGEWNGGVYCPEKEYAHGFKQKTDSWCSGGGECTGLNGIGSELIYFFESIIHILI